MQGFFVVKSNFTKVIVKKPGRNRDVLWKVAIIVEIHML